MQFILVIENVKTVTAVDANYNYNYLDKAIQVAAMFTLAAWYQIMSFVRFTLPPKKPEMDTQWINS